MDSRYQIRQLNANDRFKERAARSDEEQIARLDTMFGAGLGAKKERAKLTVRIAEAKTAKKKEK